MDKRFFAVFGGIGEWEFSIHYGGAVGRIRELGRPPADDEEPHHQRLGVCNHCGLKNLTYRHWNLAMPVCVFYTGKTGLASELSKLFPGRQRPGIKSKADATPVASAFDHDSRRSRVPTVHSKVDSTENSEEPDKRG